MKREEVRNFYGHRVTNEELEVIREVVEGCPGISRTEMANTVCELLEWKRPNGRLKSRECREYLEELEVTGLSGFLAGKGEDHGDRAQLLRKLLMEVAV